MMRWFGEMPFAPMCLDTPRVETPVGDSCEWCHEPIAAADSGVLVPGVLSGATAPHHYECFMRLINGSLGHLKRRCSCFGGTEEDPPGVSTREAARQAYHYSLLLRYEPDSKQKAH